MSKSSSSKSSSSSVIFLDRRKGDDRRTDLDLCSEIPVDLYHRKRRKSSERRDISKTLTDDYYSYMQKVMSKIEADQKKSKIADS